MEFINATQVSPLISHVQIKVCYVGQDPNRNGSVITKEIATKFGQNLPGSPIVGYYNEEKQDFEAHSREVVVKDGEFKLVDMTKPYGFVDIGAKVWFQKFNDEGVEHEYLCTEGYIWTEIYEESKRVVEKGNNQSMELNEKYEKGFWTKDQKSGKNIFIISDGLIEKLCILGSEVEPCFEGSQIKAFSLTDSELENFKATMFSMIQELKDALNKGGSEETMNNENEKQLPVEEEVPTPSPEFEKKEEEKDEKNPEDTGNEPEEEDDKKKKSYSLDEIPEYISLKADYDNLQTKYSALEQSNQTLSDELQTLREFKQAAERKEKQSMVDSFYMLSDEDKKDVVDHIDEYSLEQIEGKLAIVCVRNKVDFKLADEKNEENNGQQFMFSLQNQNTETDDDAPAWVKAVRQNS